MLTETQTKNHEVRFSDSTKNNLKIFWRKKVYWTKKPEFENLLATNQTKRWFAKMPPLKTNLNFWANFKTNIVIQRWFRFCSWATQRFALPALGRAAERRPTGKMLRRRKLLEIAAESPASGARFVGQWLWRTRWLENEFALSIACYWVTSLP